MNDAGDNKDKARASRIRDKFDRVLKRHIRRLLDSGDSESSPRYSMNMIACLLVLVEREKELVAFPGSPTKRYTRKTFLNDLDDIGIDPDDDVLVEIQDMAQNGYIHIGDDDEYRALDSATKFLSLLDAIFPSMQGLSLVGYILQSIDEVMSGRKEMMHAIRQFDETLLTRGESVSKQRVEAMRRQRAAERKKNDPAALKQRQIYLEKLRALRARKAKLSSDPTIVTTSGFSGDVEIRDLFPKESPAAQLKPEADVPIPEMVEPPTQEPPVPSDHGSPEIVSGSETTSQSPEIPSPAAEVKPVAEPMPPPPPEPPSMPSQEEEDTGTDISKEELIAQKIMAFEEELAIACPLCKKGKILADVTEKGKTYFHCGNSECNFVSWGKPHHLACPECRNPFLIEFEQKEGGIGLKCPRATCLFLHKDYNGQSLNNDQPKNERKKVRKVAVRKKGGKKGVRRRVVRRKK